MFLPAVIALIAENIGHVKSVGQMTDTDVDPLMGRALAADGVATTLAGFGGGSATTTYAENIGVMAATRIYSTAAYWVAAAVAIALALCPKVGAVISAIPPGVLGGATIVLYGLVGVLGVRIWLTNDVDFGKPLNQMTAAIPLIIGIADFTWQLGDLTFTGIALGSIAALVVYHGMRSLGYRTGEADVPPATPWSGGRRLGSPKGSSPTSTEVNTWMPNWRNVNGTAMSRRCTNAGWTTHEVPAAPDCPDSVFVEDTMVVYGDLAVICRLGADERWPEISAAEAAVSAQGYRVVRIEAPGTLDGGDVLKHDGTAWVGVGGRTNAEGIAQLAAHLQPFGVDVVSVPLTKALHLKSAATALPDGTVVGYRTRRRRPRHLG